MSDPDSDSDSDSDPDSDAAVDVTDAVDGVPAPTLTTAAERVRDGGTVVYPTETVYGLGALATDAAAVERVFSLKARARSTPISLAVPDLTAATSYVDPTARERAFMQAFLPGPVTVVLERTAAVPDVLTAGRTRVGLRVPDHPVALALLDRVAPLTATSANESGTGSAREIAGVAPAIREASAVIDGGRTPGGHSTVVDPSLADPDAAIIRRGDRADAVERWLADH